MGGKEKISLFGRVSDLGFKGSGLGFRVSGFGFSMFLRVSGLLLRVSGLGLRVYGLESLRFLGFPDFVIWWVCLILRLGS